MEISSFVLGVLSIILLAMIVTIVWGAFKIIQITKTINNQQSQMELEVDTTREDLESSIVELHDRIDAVDRSIDSAIDDVHGRIDQVNSYIDHRIDKLIDAQNANMKTKKPSK